MQYGSCVSLSLRTNIQMQKTGAMAGFYAEIPPRF